MSSHLSSSGSPQSEHPFEITSKPSHVHLVGIGGTGMSALAQLLADRTITVSGSDRVLDRGAETPVLSRLRRRGVRLYPQDGSGVHPDTSAVVISTAIEADNPDILAARERGIPIVHRTRMLVHVMGRAPCIAVAGTSGKTTVTGMIGWILTCAGVDPTVVNGGAVLNWVGEDNIGHARHGSDAVWVVEADESDRSLLAFQPEWAVLTNISADHFNFDESLDLFVQFAERVRTGLVCTPETARWLSRRAAASTVRKLIETKSGIEERNGTWRIPCGNSQMACPLPGRHNAENGLLAVTLCEALGHDAEAVGEALAGFRGIERRLQKLGSAGGITVIDDYAHNPAKIRAAWETARTMGRRVVGVWRPHGYVPLAMMAGNLEETLQDIMRNDILYVLDVYYAGGTAKREIEAEAFADRLIKRGLNITYLPDYEALEAELKAEVEPGDVVLFMGARDPGLPAFARRYADCVAGRR